MVERESYLEYTSAALEQFAAFDDDRRLLCVNAVRDRGVGSVLDVGCGAGQELEQFRKELGAFCIGVDAAPDLARVGVRPDCEDGGGGKTEYVRARGEQLPFASESFDLVTCRLAVPYMEVRSAVAEFSRVLRPRGALLLKTHAAPFFFWMVRRGIAELNVKKTAYPLICLAGGTYYIATGHRPNNWFWNGKETFQTGRQIARECARAGMRIERELPDTNRRTPSYLIVKEAA